MQRQQVQGQNTDNKEQKIKNLNSLINELQKITKGKRDDFEKLLTQLRINPNQNSYKMIFNLLQSIQPVLCTMASKVALFQNDSSAFNNPQSPQLGMIKDESVTELQESTKLQIEQIDDKTIRCTYETYNKQLAREMFKINESVDYCIGHLIDKFETYVPDSKDNIEIEKS